MLTSLLNRWFPSRKHQVPHQRKRSLLTLESLEDRTAPALDIFSGAGPLPLIEVEENNSFQTANQLTGFGGTGAIEAGDVDFFSIELNDRGRFLAFLEADHSDLNPRLTLFTQDEHELVRSDDVNGTTSALIDQHLPPGTYFLRVTSQVTTGPQSVGAYRLQHNVVSALPPFAEFIRPDGAPLKLGDLNDDGKIDIFTQQPSSGTILAFQGNGDGTFQAQRELPPGTDLEEVNDPTKGINEADLNGDGNLDSAQFGLFGSTATVFLNNSSGQEVITIPLGDGPKGTRVDINKDGSIDLVSVNGFSNDVSIVLGNGDGTFRPQQRFEVGTRPSSLKIADLNGDDRFDLVIGNSGPTVANSIQSISVLLGNGDGTFLASQRLNVGSQPRAMLTEDVNNDGRADLNNNHLYNDNLSMLIGNANETFQTDQTFSVCDLPTSVLAEDLNGDQRVDLITTSSRDNSVTVLLGNGEGTFQKKQSTVLSIRPFGADTGDFDEDGSLDLVVVGLGGSSRLLRGKGDGSFHDPVVLPGGVGSSVAVGDLDNDSHLDLVVSQNGSAVEVLLGDGQGNFISGTPAEVGQSVFQIELVDLDQDGNLDLVALHRAFTPKAVGLTIRLGNGDGFFDAPIQFNISPLPTGMQIKDLNRDGFLDIVTVSNGQPVGRNDSLTAVLNNRNGTFSQLQEVDLGDDRPGTVASSDFNLDGVPDLALANQQSDNVTVLLGTGDGGFLTDRSTSSITFRHTPHRVDLSGCGCKILVTLNRWSWFTEMEVC